MKITKRQLRRIIKEESAKKHPLSDLARRQGKTMGGTLVDPEGFYNLVQKGIEFANGKAGSALKLSESEIRRIVREERERLLNEEGPMGALVQQFADSVDLDTRTAVVEYLSTKVSDFAAQNITAQDIFPEALRKTGLATEVDMQIEEIIGGAIRDMSDVIADQIMDRIQEVLPDTVK